MDRVHRRKVLAKNQKAYYRALENLLNLCSLSHLVKEALKLPETLRVDLADLENQNKFIQVDKELLPSSDSDLDIIIEE